MNVLKMSRGCRWEGLCVDHQNAVGVGTEGLNHICGQRSREYAGGVVDGKRLAEVTSAGAVPAVPASGERGGTPGGVAGWQCCEVLGLELQLRVQISCLSDFVQLRPAPGQPPDHAPGEEEDVGHGGCQAVVRHACAAPDRVGYGS